MKFASLTSLALAAAALPAANAMAQAPAAAPTAAQPGVTTGATVYDSEGAEIGKVESVADGNVVVNTGTSRATLAAAAFGTGPKGLTLSTTKAQLEAAVSQATAQVEQAAEAALVPDAQVRGKDGTVVGKVKSLDETNVVLEREGGAAVSLSRQYFTNDANGLSLTITAAELDSATKAATPAEGAAAPSEG